MERKYIFVDQKENRDGKGGKYLERENLFIAEEMMNRGRGKYLEKEIIFFCRGQVNREGK